MIGRMMLLAGLAAGLSGCGGRWVEESIYGGDRVNAAGPSQVLQPFDPVEKIDLIATIDPNGGKTSNTLNEDEARLALEKALRNFYATEDAANNPAILASRRNRIQDRILIASEQKCNVYQIYLQRLQSETNFFFGSLTTVLGGLSTLFTSEGLTRALAGSAAISSGLGAEFNQHFLFGQLVPVITKGIEKKRDAVMRNILKKRILENGSTSGVEHYTLEAAIADAVEYHGACTISSALAEASDSLEMVRNPGIQEALRIQYMVNDLRNAAEGQKPKFAAYYDPDSLELPGVKNNYVTLAGASSFEGALPAEVITSVVTQFVATMLNARGEAARLAQDATDPRSTVVKAAEASIGTAFDGANTSLEGFVARLRCLDEKGSLTGGIAQARADLAAKRTSDNRAKLMSADLKAYQVIGGPIDTVAERFRTSIGSFLTALNAGASDTYQAALTKSIGDIGNIKVAVDAALAPAEMKCP